MNWIKRIFKKKDKQKKQVVKVQPMFIPGRANFTVISDRDKRDEPIRSSNDDSSVFDTLTAISFLDSFTPDSSSSYDSSDSGSSSSDFSGFDGGDFGGGGSSSDW